MPFPKCFIKGRAKNVSPVIRNHKVKTVSSLSAMDFHERNGHVVPLSPTKSRSFATLAFKENMESMNYFLVITSILFLSACAGRSGMTDIKSDQYVGIYSDPASGDYKVIINEQNGKLFGKDRRGKDEIIQETDTDFRLKSMNVRGRFNKLENGKYQFLLIKENGIETRLTRLAIPQAKHQEAIYDSIDDLIKIDEKKHEQNA